MKKISLFPLVLVVSLLSSCALLPPERPDLIVQNSTISALSAGIYEGYTTFGTLRKFGDFGIGTFDNLDGEMVAVDGIFYQIRDNGIAYQAGDSMKTPFAVVTFFSPEIKLNLQKGMTYDDLRGKQSRYLDSPNMFYAIKIHGTFSSLKVRSVPVQSPPFRRLDQVLGSEQRVYEFSTARGVMVGFFCPQYASGINVPGLHFHFITDDRNAGGHVLDFVVEEAVIEIDEKTDIFLSLPLSNAFRKS
ncbi:MAG: acetolactate decarboxylase [Victivallales bacterium]|nr:acetolactate decarboxylase [Victivallales bacterium]